MTPLRNLPTLNRRGLIPGPGETEAAFLARVGNCEAKELPEGADFANGKLAASSYLEEACALTQSHYDIAPDWALLFFGNEGLVPWHGGMTWIGQGAPLIQLRQSLKNTSSLFGFYSREELIAHELCHAARAAFEEPQFEELLAYRTSPSRFRRWFGPLLRSPKESTLFLLTLLLASLIQFGLLFWRERLVFWPFILPGVLVGVGMARLIKSHWQFARCLSKVTNTIGAKRAEALLFRLTDREIREIGRLQADEIRSYLHSLPPSPRREVLLSYCRGNAIPV